MRHVALILSLLVSAQFISNGQTLGIVSAVINGHTAGLYLDSGSYTTEKLDTTTYVVTYDTSILVDTLTREVFTSKYLLLIGQEMNKYFPENKFKYDLARTKGLFYLKMCKEQHHVFFYDAVYQDRLSGVTTTTKRLCEDDFLVTEETPVQSWVLSDEKREIAGHECSLAECDFRGRHYYAWYAEDIPLPYGPWKLGGLPGLIVSAYDTDHQYEFTMSEYGSEHLPIFRFNYNYIKTDRGKLNKLTNEVLHKPIVYMANHYHLTTRHIEPERLAKEKDIVYQYDTIEKD